MSGAKVIYVLAAFFGCSCRHFNFSFSHLSLHSALGWVASGCWEGSSCVCEELAYGVGKREESRMTISALACGVDGGAPY